MTGTDLNHLKWLQAVAEEGSFTKAAARLGVAQSTLSHTIKQLEAILAWGHANGVTRYTLHASAAGQPLYAIYGFAQTNEMRLE